MSYICMCMHIRHRALCTRGVEECTAEGSGSKKEEARSKKQEARRKKQPCEAALPWPCLALACLACPGPAPGPAPGAWGCELPVLKGPPPRWIHQRPVDCIAPIRFRTLLLECLWAPFGVFWDPFGCHLGVCFGAALARKFVSIFWYRF